MKYYSGLKYDLIYRKWPNTATTRRSVLNLSPGISKYRETCVSAGTKQDGGERLTFFHHLHPSTGEIMEKEFLEWKGDKSKIKISHPYQIRFRLNVQYSSLSCNSQLLKRIVPPHRFILPPYRLILPSLWFILPSLWCVLPPLRFILPSLGVFYHHSGVFYHHI